MCAALMDPMPWRIVRSELRLIPPLFVEQQQHNRKRRKSHEHKAPELHGRSMTFPLRRATSGRTGGGKPDTIRTVVILEHDSLISVELYVSRSLLEGQKTLFKSPNRLC